MKSNHQLRRDHRKWHFVARGRGAGIRAGATRGERGRNGGRKWRGASMRHGIVAKRHRPAGAHLAAQKGVSV